MDYVLIKDYLYRYAWIWFLIVLCGITFTGFGIFFAYDSSVNPRSNVPMVVIIFVITLGSVSACVQDIGENNLFRSTRFLPVQKKVAADTVWFMAVMIPVALTAAVILLSILLNPGTLAILFPLSNVYSKILPSINFSIAVLVTTCLVNSLLFISLGFTQRFQTLFQPTGKIQVNFMVFIVAFGLLIYLLVFSWFSTGLIGKVMITCLSFNMIFLSRRYSMPVFDSIIGNKVFGNEPEATPDSKELNYTDRMFGSVWGTTAFQAMTVFYIMYFAILVWKGIEYFSTGVIRDEILRASAFSLPVMAAIVCCFHYVMMLKVIASLPVSRKKIIFDFFVLPVSGFLPILSVSYLIVFFSIPEILPMVHLSIVISVSMLLMTMAFVLQIDKGRWFMLFTFFLPQQFVMKVERLDYFYSFYFYLFLVLGVLAFFNIYHSLTRSNKPFQRRILFPGQITAGR